MIKSNLLKSKISKRVTAINLLIMALSLAVIVVISAVTMSGVARTASMRFAHIHSLESVKSFLNNTAGDLALLRSLANSEIVREWFADEYNDEKRQLAFNYMSASLGSFESMELYFGILDSLNEYAIDTSTTIEDFTSYGRMTVGEPVDAWFFDLIDSNKQFLFNIDVDKIAHRWSIWINYEVIHEGRAVGVICTPLRIDDLLDNIFSQHDENYIRGYVIDSSGFIHIGSTALEHFTYLDDELIHISSVDLGLSNFIDDFVGRNERFFSDDSVPEVIPLRDGTFDYAAVAPIANSDWMLVTVFNSNVLFNIGTMFPFIVPLVAVLAVFMVISTVVMRYYVLTPLAKLSDSVSNIDDVDSENSMVYGAERADEIGELSQSIGVMLNNIKHTRQELEAQEVTKAILDAHELTQMIFDSAPFVINLWDDAMNLMSTSEYAIKLHEVADKEEYIAQFLKLSPEFQPCGTASGEMIPVYMGKVYDEGYARFEWVHCTLDGKPIPTEITLVRFERHGKPMIVAYTHDLSMVKAAMQREQELELKLRNEEADERVRLLFDATPLMVEYWDKNYKGLYCNQTTLDYYGLSTKEEYASRQQLQMYESNAWDEWNRHLAKIYESGSGSFEFWEQKLNGNPVCLEVDAVRLKYNNETVVATYTRNITRLKEIEREVKLSQEKEREAYEMINALVDASPTFIEIWDEDLNLVDCNIRVKELFELSCKEEFIERYGELSPEYQPCGTPSKVKGRSFLEKALQDGYSRCEWMHLTLDGEEFPVDAIFVRLELQGKVMIVEYNHDLRQIKESMAATQRIEIAEESSRAKSRFLARMSHEIRTPIAAVMGISEIHMQAADLPPQTEEAFTKIYTSSKMLLGIINDILDLSKIEAGKMELVSEKYDVASLISDVAHMHLSYVKSTNIEFKLVADENLPAFLIGDSLRIEQIMNNVLSNAFKYTKSGTVEMSLKCQLAGTSNTTLVLSISDTGMGMSAEQLESLSNDYTRFHEDKNRHITGTGLGMPIVYNLVHLMGADIQLTSEVGVGTTVKILIPQEIAGSETIGREVAKGLEKFEFGVKAKKFEFTPEPMPYGSVLVVDDIDANLYVARGLLAFYNLKIETCINGFQAIEKIKQGEIYDIIFMDQMMPGIDGTETMKQLREMNYEHPIIALTANALIGQAEEFVKEGFDGFLSKPIQTKLLNAILLKYVKDKQPPEVIKAAAYYTEKTGKYTKGIHDYQDDENLVKKLRIDFEKRYKNSFSEIKIALDIGDFNTAHRLAHNLKGLAGLIKEPRLAQHAKVIEDILSNSGTPSRAQLNTLGDELTSVLESISKPASTLIPNNKKLDKTKSLAVLDRLIPLLASRNIKCLDALDELRLIPEAAALCSQIESFDFGLALATIPVLRKLIEEQESD
ncbi:MAG: response regulator [Defluviitaleaceae bacterium]|nr:response regulator [Defluviitaleaceae bacterium]